MASQHILSSFEDALSELRGSVLTMASVAQHNLEHSIKGLLSRDQTMCNEAIAEDDDVDSSEKSIDAQGHQIILRFSPVAFDLRQVLMAMKIAANLERVSDQAVGVARRARKIIKHPELPEIHEIEPLYELAMNQLRDSVKSFSDGDEKLALTLPERDDQLDRVYKKISKRLISAMEEKPEALKALIHLLFVVRCLERIGDHTVNIAEDTIFMVSARDIRHLDLADVEDILA